MRKLNVTDGQTDGRTDGQTDRWGALQYLPSRAFGAAGDKKCASYIGERKRGVVVPGSTGIEVLIAGWAVIWVLVSMVSGCGVTWSCWSVCFSSLKVQRITLVHFNMEWCM